MANSNYLEEATSYAYATVLLQEQHRRLLDEHADLQRRHDALQREIAALHGLCIVDSLVVAVGTLRDLGVELARSGRTRQAERVAGLLVGAEAAEVRAAVRERRKKITDKERKGMIQWQTQAT